MEQKEQNGLALLLAMDTTTSSLTVALVDERGRRGEKNIHSERNHSIRLVPAIRELMRECGAEFRDLSGVAVGKGPGSYTGVRIGVTVAKTMAWSLNLPLLAVSSLEALAFGAFGDLPETKENEGGAGLPCWVVPFMDARRGQVYTGLYEGKAGEWRCLESDGIRSLARWREELALRCEQLGPAGPGTILFTGDAVFLQETLSGMPEPFPCEVRFKPWHIQAADVGRLAMSKYVRGEAEPVHAFVPNYTQMAEAEVKWMAGKYRGERT